MHSKNSIKTILCLFGGVALLLIGSIAHGADSAYGDTCSRTSLAKTNGNQIKVSAGGSIQSAMNKARPGDTIVIACGKYNQGGTLQTSGTSKAWITVKAASPHCAKIYGTIQINKADYVRVEGLEVINGKIGALACHHIEFVNNVVDNGQMMLNLSDFLLVDSNEVFGASEYFNLVSILNPQNITGDTTTKNRIVVRNNVFHDNKWTRKTDGAGMIFDNGIERQLAKFSGDNFPALKQNRVKWASYKMGGIIENNIFYGNNGAGSTLYNANGVTVRDNISAHNHQRKDKDSTWSGEILNTNGSNNTFVNNVTILSGAKKTYGLSCQYFKDYTSSTFKRNENIKWNDNVTCNLKKSDDRSIATQSLCEIPEGTNDLGDCDLLKPLGLLNGNDPTKFVIACKGY